MSLFVVGKLLNDKGKSIAYRLYDSDTKQVSQLFAREDVKDIIINRNIEIAGLGIKSQVDFDNHDITRSVLIESKHIFDMRKMTQLDCYGETTSESKLIVIGVIGFQENRQFKCVNNNGEESIIPYLEFKELIKSGKIIGASLNKDIILIHKQCNNQIYIQ